MRVLISGCTMLLGGRFQGVPTKLLYKPTTKQKQAKQMHIYVNTVVAVYAKATERKAGTYFKKHSTP